jgi:DNA/RNA-binding domain of Phe-tRNA-synthetase-like protein
MHKYLANPVFVENKVIASWRSAYARAGLEGERSSLEALFNEALDTGKIGAANPFSDLANTVSLIWALPVLSFDLDRLSGDIGLAIKDGCVAYYDGAGPISEGWCSGVCQRAAVTYGTKNALAVINLCDPERDLEVVAALKTFSRQIASFLSGQAKTEIIKEGSGAFSF